MLALIIGCEIAFWVVLVAGLLARYVAKAPRLGLALLICVPLVDLVLLIATVVDLRSGATAEWAHGLAAVYLGFSVAYGHQMITWADGWAAYFWGSGPRPSKRYGREHATWASARATALRSCSPSRPSGHGCRCASSASGRRRAR